MDDGLTEDEVIQGTATYLLGKGKTTKTEIRKIVSVLRAKEHGVDLCVYKGTPEGAAISISSKQREPQSSKDNLREAKEVQFPDRVPLGYFANHLTHRLRLQQENNRIYGIAIPKTELPRCLRLIRDNWALKTLGIRLFCAYRDDNGELFAQELTPSKIYTEPSKGGCTSKPQNFPYICRCGTKSSAPRETIS